MYLLKGGKKLAIQTDGIFGKNLTFKISYDGESFGKRQRLQVRISVRNIILRY